MKIEVEVKSGIGRGGPIPYDLIWTFTSFHLDKRVQDIHQFMLLSSASGNTKAKINDRDTHDRMITHTKNTLRILVEAGLPEDEVVTALNAMADRYNFGSPIRFDLHEHLYSLR